MLHISDPLLKLGLLAFVGQHQRRLLVLSILRSLFHLPLALVEGLPLLLELGLEVKHLLVSVSLHSIQLLLQSLTVFLFLLPFLCQINSSSLTISDRKLKFLIEELLVLLELGDLGRQLKSILIRTFLLLLEPLVGLLLHVSHLLLE